MAARIMAPTGELGTIPEEQLESALAAGATLMTPEKMRELRQQVFMEDQLFRETHRRPEKRRRRSIVRSRKNRTR
jgi:hypothetical protein